MDQKRRQCPNTLSTYAILAENATSAVLMSEGREGQREEMIKRCDDAKKYELGERVGE